MGQVQKAARDGQPAVLPNSLGETIFTAFEWDSCPALLLPLDVPPMPTPACSPQSLSQDSESWRVFNTTDVGNAKRGQGVPDHQVLPISGAQHVRARCQLFHSCFTDSLPMSYQGCCGA